MSDDSFEVRVAGSKLVCGSVDYVSDFLLHLVFSPPRFPSSALLFCIPFGLSLIATSSLF